ncbi:MAG: hypothetical protein R3185_06800, partial [Candidatus Thermoplasmatota archaeon]|nr:hypothetical protein [Candidatus Thermoplasmatota archaeon]
MSVLKTLIALSLLVAPATLGIATYTGTLDLTDGSPSPEDFGGQAIETFEKDLDDPAVTGWLDLRIDDGAVRVIGWDQDAYKVMVLQPPTDDGAVHDQETEV